LDNSSCSRNIQTDSGAHWVSYSMATECSFPGNKGLGTWSWTLTSSNAVFGALYTVSSVVSSVSVSFKVSVKRTCKQTYWSSELKLKLIRGWLHGSAWSYHVSCPLNDRVNGRLRSCFSWIEIRVEYAVNNVER
jgi:hypothetical protein